MELMQRNLTANLMGRDKKKNHNWVQTQGKEQTNDFRTTEIKQAKEFSFNMNYSKPKLNWTKPNYAAI